ncbi:hypothetical protein BTO06_15725 [Tenacibaculum sp. SZ-18]|uniref:hypothetical protein n=1 Tax=Tenacibaculum sp. SZ-18 TaxID=754423 RepID=UPI000C2D3D91|nr:hypothetical protein [Tenacibaculum sp. SZ-18]AUC16510.1 hypothetical protein BTO06_15725 [Tenacibaculum sp. SZ-18]
MQKIYLILLIFFTLSFREKQKKNIPGKKEQTEIDLKEVKTKKAELNYTTSVTDVALKFINDYVSNCNKMKAQIGIIEFVNTHPNVSKEFKTELIRMIEEAEKADPEHGLGFDPIFDAQDCPDDGFKLSEFDSKTNYLTVEAINWKGFTITMKIKELDNKWFVEGCGVVNIPKDKQAKR